MDRRAALKRTSLLMGTALTPGVIAGILNGCTPRKELDWKPVYFNEQDANTVGNIADLIIPTTSTPGALDVGVDQFIDLMVQDCFDQREKDRFSKGVKEINELSNGDFISLNDEEKIKVLTEIEDSDSEAGYAFASIKSLTLLGYFTSEQGITSNYDYKPVPGRYSGCETYNGKMEAGARV